MLKTILVTAAIAAIAGGAAGAIGMAKWDARAVTRLAGDLADARRTAVAERAAREAIHAQCLAGDAAATRAADLDDAAQRAIQRANQALDDGLLRAVTPGGGDDSDPLRAQFERLRGPAGSDVGSAAAPAEPDRGAVPRSP
jgi:hypothetical protein